MTDRMLGDVDVHPWLVVAVASDSGKGDVKFLVDTGFDGEIALPQSYATWFGVSGNTINTEYANRHRMKNKVLECQIDWMGELRDVTAIYIDGQHPLLGMDLMDNCVVTIETANRRGEISVESTA